MRVREIMGIHEITAVPQTPAYVKGVLNLRDKVIPVVDLRLKFGNRPEKLMLGIIVDRVSEVLTLPAADIEDTPDFGNGVETPLHFGDGQDQEQGEDSAGYQQLEINGVFTAQEVVRIERVAGSEA
jgi:chemotaxis signal transduction protein